MLHLGRVTTFFLALATTTAPTLAQEPGDIFREYGWKYGPWQRQVGHDATASGAKSLLPNRVNSVTISDLKDSIRAEVQIEKLTSHAGTVYPKFRINGNAWIDIPEPDPKEMPANRGSNLRPAMHLTLFYPKVQIPLSQLKEGTNKFEMTCQGTGGHGQGAIWPQFIVHGMTFRIYYKASKPHPTGEITYPSHGSVVSDNPTFKAKVSSDARQVDFIGDYEDFDWRGDGSAGWQNGYSYSKVIDHIGRATTAPWQVQWNTRWIPTQTRPFRIAARIKNSAGITYITRAVNGVSLSRKKTVVRYLNTKIPFDWIANYWHAKRECETKITDDLSKAEEARVFLRTWNGRQDGKLYVNNTLIATRPGKNYDLSWDQFPLARSVLRSGVNNIHTTGSKTEHGMEVLWPGPEVFVRYDIPESRPEFVTYGENCSSTLAKPVLSIVGQPKIGTSYTLQVSGILPNSASFMLWGLSNLSHSGIPLPLALDPFGAPNCRLWTSAERTILGFANSVGTASYPVYVPKLPSLVGAVFFNQAMVAEPKANFVGVLVTSGARTLVGR